MTAAPICENPYVAWLPDGARLRMRHGPIDLIVAAFGERDTIRQAYMRATAAFGAILGELAGELDILRQPVDQRSRRPTGAIARHMVRETRRIAAGRFATPMIAVAGAVADHILSVLTSGGMLKRAYVNNGGDIALYLTPGQCFDVGVCADPLSGQICSKARISTDDAVGGIATSGWRGRSHSLGIADAVTVLARNAACADAAATLIANAIDLPDHPAIARRRADELSPDSDLGARQVTTGVGALSGEERRLALSAGYDVAAVMVERGRIASVFAAFGPETFVISPAAGINRKAHPR